MYRAGYSFECKFVDALFQVWGSGLRYRKFPGRLKFISSKLKLSWVKAHSVGKHFSIWDCRSVSVLFRADDEEIF